MKILLAHKLYELTGGAEVFFRETERTLRERGDETLMVATGTAQTDQPTNLILLDAPKYDSGNALSKGLHLKSAIYDTRKKGQFKKIIRDYQPDVMHIFAINVHLSPSIIDAAYELGIPIVATFNDYKHICPNYKLFANDKVCFACKGERFFNAVIKRCCKDSVPLSVASAIEAYVHKWLGVYEKIDHITFSSDFMAKQTEAFWDGRAFSWSKLRNPFDSRSFSALTAYDPYGLYFGRIIGEKGVSLLLDAAHQINGFPIKIVGSGPDLESLRARAADEGLDNVEFLGPMWGDDLNSVLARARFVVVPSIWHENFPYVINQAFAYGRPVIGSRRGGITELVDDGLRGVIFDPDRPAELASAINRLAQDDAAVQRMGSAAKEYSDLNFNDAVFLAELDAAYRGGIDAHHRRRG